jgi:hypothetical protein
MAEMASEPLRCEPRRIVEIITLNRRAQIGNIHSGAGDCLANATVKESAV